MWGLKRGYGKVWTCGVGSSIVKTRQGISDVIVYSRDMYDSERYVEFNEKRDRKFEKVVVRW